ncbi:MAG: RidA family protein [Marinobacter sp.]|uniref:RidA family protein n=1 Tax=Marinobacter sp. TaxID=50741 RepID=UPI0034A06F6A
MTIKRIHSGKRISRVVVHNGIAYLAGLQALKSRGGTVAEQTGDVLGMIDRLLGEAGTDKRHLLTATIWLADIRTAEEMNQVWDEWMPEGCSPARATVEGKPASAEHSVKIAVTAAIID